MESKPNCGNISPMSSWVWGNARVKSMSTEPSYDGDLFWHWYPNTRFILWFDSPMTEEELASGDICYRFQGNVWLCPNVPEETMPVEPEPMPEPVGNVLPMFHGNVRPNLTLTSVKMENHPEHIAVMFGQVLSSLK